MVKKRKKNMDKEIEKLDAKLSIIESKDGGLKKLDTLIKTMSKKRSEKLGLTNARSKRHAKRKEFSRLKIKHLSSMTERWRRLRATVKTAAKMQAVNLDIQ